MNCFGFYSKTTIYKTVVKVKIRHFICLSLIFLPFITLAQKQDTSLHIYILVGQSNMAGRGVLTAEYKTLSNDRVLMFNKENTWVTATNPLHFDKPKSVGVGPGFSFGIQMTKASDNKNAKIGLLPCAVGGTSIAKWQPGAFDEPTNTHPYDDAILRIKEAQKYGVVKGIIWHQGEADSRDKNVAVYLENLSALIDRLRTLCGNQTLPFVAGELGRYRSNSVNFNIEIAKLPKKVAHTVVVSSEGLWHKGDNIHFDSPSATELGRRYASGMQQLQGKKISREIYTAKQNFNTLTAQEKADGWELLFNGKEPGIRFTAFQKDEFPQKGWLVEEEALVLLSGNKGNGDIITREQFSDFELSLDYKLSDSANTGIKYFVSDLKTKDGKTDLNGPEFQLIDDFMNESVKDNKHPITSSGSLYLLYAPENKMLNAPNQWNNIRIVAKGKHVEHWLNGRKIVIYERGSQEFRSLVAKTKFANYVTPYGESEMGAILIQDQNREASFRDIKIRRLN